MDRRKFIKGSICAGCIMAGLYGAKRYSDNMVVTHSPKEGFIFKHTEVHLVEHCNVDCKYCSHFSCIAEKEIYEVPKFDADMDRLAKLTNHLIQDFGLLGGEPLLHPNITDIFKLSREYFPFTAFDLLTNATLLDNMPESFWKAVKKYNIQLVPSIYKFDINWESIIEKVKKYDVIMKFENWEGELTAENIRKNVIQYFYKLQLDKTASQDMNRVCTARGNCNNFIRGKIYPCFVISNVHHLNKKFGTNFKVTEEDYLDIYKVKDIKTIKDFVYKPVPFCKYCNPDTGSYKWENNPNHTVEEWTLKNREE